MEKIKYTFCKICDTIKNIKNEISFYKELWKRPEGKAALLKVLSQLKYLWEKAGPSKMQGHVIFGTGDPAVTGQLLGVFGMIYGALPKEVSIIPDFEEERYEGTIHIKGKLKLIHVLLIVIRLLSDRNFKIVVKEIMDREGDRNEQ